MKTHVDISVIVPVYNVEDYLEECLDSLLRQGDVSLEVIIVDDGSPDSCGEIADRYTEEHPNFQCHHIENGGLGHARNYGVQFATGKYLFFVDSDDKVVDFCLEKLFKIIERDQSDMAICNVRRFNSKKTWGSVLHKKAFFNLPMTTHITESTNLINDTTAWNKLIRKSFFDKYSFHFPEGILYEDIPVTIPMHYRARRVSVLSAVGYLWRDREGAEKSITQTATDMRNLRDRISVLNMLDDFFEKNVSEEELITAKQYKTLDVDLDIFINNCEALPEELAKESLELINEYISSNINEDTYSLLSPIKQIKYLYARNEMIEWLNEARHYQKNHLGTATILENRGKISTQFPDDVYAGPAIDGTYALTKEPPLFWIDDIEKDGDTLKVTGHIYRKGINITKVGEQRVKALLFDEVTGNECPVDTHSIIDSRLTEQRGSVLVDSSKIISKYNYDAASFVITFSLKELVAVSDDVNRFRIRVEFETRFEKSSVILGGVNKPLAERFNHVGYLIDDKHVQIDFREAGIMQITILEDFFAAESFVVTEDELQIALNRQPEAVYLYHYWEDEKIEPTLLSSGVYGFSLGSIDVNKKFLLRVRDSGQEQTVISKNKEHVFHETESMVLLKNSARNHRISIVLKERIAVIGHKKKLGVNSFCLMAQSRGLKMTRPKRAELFFLNSLSQERIVLSSSRCFVRKGHIYSFFLVNLASSDLVRDFYAGKRDLQIRYYSIDNYYDADVYVASRFMYSINAHSGLKIECYRSIEGTCRLQFKQVWAAEEDSLEKRNRIVAEEYPKYMEYPINSKLILFESMWGRKYSCNPRALYEYIDKTYPEYECVWSFNDARTPIEGRGKRVRRGSADYWRVLATAKYLVNNVNFEDRYIKRPGQIEIQTMHGTPLKTLGLDIPNEFTTQKGKEAFIRRNSRWDYLITQGEFVESIAYSAYRYKGPFLETGYPRTDAMLQKETEDIITLKTRLGIPLDKKIILYAPTWRKEGRFDLNLDLGYLQDELNSDWFLIIKLHHLSPRFSGTVDIESEFCKNLTAYNSIEELLTLADVLITDYSSVMFDYALLNRPILFYTYDLQEYKDHLRGFYFDFEKEAPGPLLFTNEEVVAAVKNSDQYFIKHEQRYNNFKNKYLTFESNHSCEAIMQQVFTDDQ